MIVWRLFDDAVDLVNNLVAKPPMHDFVARAPKSTAARSSGRAWMMVGWRCEMSWLLLVIEDTTDGRQLADGIRIWDKGEASR